MRVACITTARGDGSRAAAALELIEPYLREHMELVRFVPAGSERGVECSLGDLRPREFDQVLYVIADEPQPAFALRWLRRLGGTVWLLDAELAQLAFAASPRLARGGVLGFVQAVRHGGLAQARVYRRLRRGADGRVHVPHEQRSELALQRGVTRFGDAFLVHSETLAQHLRADRNEPTPIAVLRAPADAARMSQLSEEALSRLASEMAAALAAFPQARAARRPLLVAALRAAEEIRRRER